MSAPRSRVLIVDGHSMIFQWPELSALHARNGATARDQLVRALTRHQDSTGIHVIAVFDGRGTRTSQDAEEIRIQVFYSKSGQTADSVIERIVATYASKYEIVVATDDHMERTTVESFGASWMSSAQLALELRAADGELEDRIKRLRGR
ncbi:MAG: NYN domain-containing protein [Chthoniobacterales bacterium]